HLRLGPRTADDLEELPLAIGPDIEPHSAVWVDSFGELEPGPDPGKLALQDVVDHGSASGCRIVPPSQTRPGRTGSRLEPDPPRILVTTRSRRRDAPGPGRGRTAAAPVSGPRARPAGGAAAPAPHRATRPDTRARRSRRPAPPRRPHPSRG